MQSSQPERHDQAAVRTGQLLAPGRRDIVGGDRQDDAVVGVQVGIAQRAVGLYHLHLVEARGVQMVAGAGDQALEVLEKESFSLMLCDVRMPGMTGVQVVPQARAVDPARVAPA